MNLYNENSPGREIARGALVFALFVVFGVGNVLFSRHPHPVSWAIICLLVAAWVTAGSLSGKRVGAIVFRESLLEIRFESLLRTRTTVVQVEEVAIKISRGGSLRVRPYDMVEISKNGTTLCCISRLDGFEEAQVQALVAYCRQLESKN